ncbi:MAG TPA: hypothetical protein PKX13_12010 [Acidiphilium sp.]|nr:MAG: hypothetical protein B7Z68_00715 [Acidobacteria bacterium 21-70-11]HQU24993.1 hypothetical protein [Acidiphilium sp.]
MNTRRISKTYATAIYHGDPVVSESTGYIQQAAPGTTQIAGIFAGCKYLSVSQGRTLWSSYWPGADAAQDVECYIIDDPSAVFTVQANGGPVALADVGSNVNFAIGTGTASSGMSGATLDASTIATTATLPFRIVGYVGDNMFSGAGPGSDPTTAYNYVFVTFNNQDFKSLTGI